MSMRDETLKYLYLDTAEHSKTVSVSLVKSLLPHYTCYKKLSTCAVLQLLFVATARLNLYKNVVLEKGGTLTTCSLGHIVCEREGW
jgi:hypothetical protein